MRTSLWLLAPLLATAPSPASAAAFFDVGISGTLTGTEIRLTCLGDPACQEITPFQRDFRQILGMLPLQEGENSFQVGLLRANGIYEGTIVNRGGFLTGVNLRYGFTNCPSSRPCSDIFATAATFTVTGGIPEPSTWALMLFGFGVAGSLLRRQQRHDARQASSPLPGRT